MAVSRAAVISSGEKYEEGLSASSGGAAGDVDRVYVEDAWLEIAIAVGEAEFDSITNTVRERLQQNRRPPATKPDADSR